MQKHKVRHEPLTPDFSRPIQKVKVNPFPERNPVEVELRAEIRRLNSLLTATRKQHAVVEGVLASQKRLDDQQISDLRALVFSNIKLAVTEAH